MAKIHKIEIMGFEIIFNFTFFNYFNKKSVLKKIRGYLKVGITTIKLLANNYLKIVTFSLYF